MQTMTAQPTGFQLRSAAPAQLRAGRAAPRCQARSSVRVLAADKQRTVLIGLAADSGCGKSTFMRRMTNLFGGNAKPPAGGNPDSNTLIRCAQPLCTARSPAGPACLPALHHADASAPPSPSPRPSACVCAVLSCSRLRQRADHCAVPGRLPLPRPGGPQEGQGHRTGTGGAELRCVEAPCGRRGRDMRPAKSVRRTYSPLRVAPEALRLAAPCAVAGLETPRVSAQRDARVFASLRWRGGGLICGARRERGAASPWAVLLLPWKPSLPPLIVSTRRLIPAVRTQT